jgi:phytoene desaturase
MEAATEHHHLLRDFFAQYALVYQGLDDLDDYLEDWIKPGALKSPNLVAVMMTQYQTLEKAKQASANYIEQHLKLMNSLHEQLTPHWHNVSKSCLQKISQRFDSPKYKKLKQNKPSAIVVGGGLGGMAAALRLRAKGYEVQLVERLPELGGRAQVYVKDGFRHDAGPTVITAPFLLAELFTLFDKKIEDYIELKSLNPWYRFVFADGSSFNYGGTIEDTLKEIERINPADKAGYLKLVAESKKIFDVGFQQLADKPFDQFLSMIRSIPHLIRLKSYKSVWQFVSRYLKEPRLRQAFSIQPLLVGGNPFDTSCIYSLIHYLEREWGISFPMGGTGALIKALTRLMREEGIELTLNTTVKEIVIKDKTARGIIINEGQFIPADVIVSNADTPYCYTHMISNDKQALSARLKTRYAQYSMGLFVYYFGSTRTYPEVAHHTICIGTRYKSLLKDIFIHKKLTDDFSMYVHRPTATDSSFAPSGCDSFYVLVPVPNLQGKIDWKQEGVRLRDAIIKALSNSILPEIEQHLVADFFKTPEDFNTDYLSLHGAGFSIAPLLRQSAWFRYHNRAEGIKGLYHVGAGTHPGAGIPGVLSSAKVVDSLIDAVPKYVNKEVLG